MFGQMGPFVLLMILLAVGSVLGIGLGYILWNPGATNYSVISTSEDATRTARFGDLTVTFPSVLICKAGEESSITIEVSNLDDAPEYVIISLSIVRSSGVDSGTISAITSRTYRATLAAYGSATYVLSFEPVANGYAIFDVAVKGELAGSITLYVVASP